MLQAAVLIISKQSLHTFNPETEEIFLMWYLLGKQLQNVILVTAFVHEVFKVKLVIEILVEDNGTAMQREELNFTETSLPCLLLLFPALFVAARDWRRTTILFLYFRFHACFQHNILMVFPVIERSTTLK